MEMKQTKKFNVVDVLVVVLVLLLLAFAGYKLLGHSEEESSTVHISYTVKCENVSKEVYDNCQKYLPSQLMASGQLYDGSIKSVTEKPYYVLSGNGQWVEDPNRVTLYFDVECNVPGGSVMTTKVGEQEVRVGKTDYILKSEYIELDKCEITSVTWDK